MEWHRIFICVVSSGAAKELISAGEDVSTGIDIAFVIPEAGWQPLGMVPSGWGVVFNSARRVFLIEPSYKEFPESLDLEIRSVLEVFSSFSAPCVGGVLRLGVFYDLRETVIFPLWLEAETIGLMKQLNLALEFTGYPCSDGES